MLSAHAHNKYCDLVKVVNNASGTILSMLLATRRLECKAPSNQSVLPTGSLDLVQRENQWFFG